MILHFVNTSLFRKVLFHSLGLHSIVNEFSFNKQISGEVGLESFKYQLEYLGVISEDDVLDVLLESGFELVEERVLISKFGIPFELLVVVFGNFSIHILREGNQYGLVKPQQPELDLFLLFITIIDLLKPKNEFLEGSNHISKEPNTNHLHQHHVQILQISLSCDFPIPNRGESGDDPIKSSDVKTQEVCRVTYFFLLDDCNPARVINNFFVLTNGHPCVCNDVGHEHKLYHKSENTI